MSRAERDSEGTSASEAPEEGAGSSGGLVISRISSRLGRGESDDVGDPFQWEDARWSPRIPNPSAITVVKRILDEGGQADAFQVGSQILRVGPGVLQFSRRGAPKASASGEESGHVEKARAAISAFSKASQRNLIKKMGSVDWTPLFSTPGRRPAMVTLTLPGDWLTVAPDGPAFKRLVKNFVSRYERAWNEPLRGVWKLEFQRRGAPHLHIFMSPPVVFSESRSVAFRGLPFQEWLSRVWAHVVAHPDPSERSKHLLAGTGIDFAKGLRASNPQQITVYFLKHSLNKSSAKEYQNVAPEAWTIGRAGPGRFWGMWALEDVSAEISLNADEWVFISRTVRRYLRAQGQVRRTRVIRRSVRVDGSTGELVEIYRYRTVSRRVQRLSRSAGFVVLDDAPALLSSLALWMRERGGAM